MSADKYRELSEAARKEHLLDWTARTNLPSLSSFERDKLKKNRILITGETYKQIFEAYENPESCPFFITSDSLLNGYHVLYEESIRKMELRLADRGPVILNFMLTNLNGIANQPTGNPELVAAAEHRAKLVLGIALRLMDAESRFNDPELDRQIDAEVSRIETAEGMFRPEWLGDSPVQMIDYSRYKPRGFYTQTESLKRYFRAVAWLQSIPFRLKNDEELLSVLMMANSLNLEYFKDETEQQSYTLFFDAYSLFIGVQEDWSLLTELKRTKTGYGQFTEDLNGEGLDRCRKYMLEYKERPLINDQWIDEENEIGPNYRVISAYRTPAAVLFQRTADTREFQRSFPAGLEVAVALGSGFAQQALNDPDKEKLLKTIDASQPYFSGKSLYFQYLDALRCLLDKPEPDAPDFMFNPAWQIKSCNTVLGGWTQLCSTWILHSKEVLTAIGCCIDIKSGFVEPEPEFFGHMAELARNTSQILEQSGVFNCADTTPESPKVWDEDFDIKARWEHLETVSRQLQIIAHKQLRGVDLNQTENELIEHYGEYIKFFMLCNGITEDNAPRIADVFSNSQNGRYLHAGIGRPRKMYVLYPWKGNHVLCKGAVLPYYEFTRRERLTRDEWQSLLDSDKRPDSPKWFQPLEE
jgi:hypothetical protein